MSGGARILLAADGGPRVGLGHVMRVRSVAQALRARGVEPVLLVHDRAGAERLAGAGFTPLASPADALAAGPFDAALLDGFHEWPEVAPALRERGARLVLMENRTALRPRAAVVVYPGLHYEPDDWDRAHEERVRSGPGWTPLSRELLALSPAAEPDLDLLVTFGGSDPGALTERSLAALARTGTASARSGSAGARSGSGGARSGSAGARSGSGGARIAVVLGPHMGARQGRVAAALAPLGGELIEAPDFLGPWIARARAVLTAVGTTLAECAWLGVPALVLANYAADAPALASYARRGPHVPLGVAGALDEPSLVAALERGLEALSGRLRAPLALLGEGSARLARLLAEGA